MFPLWEGECPKGPWVAPFPIPVPESYTGQGKRVESDQSQFRAPQAPMHLWPCPFTSGSHGLTRHPCSAWFPEAEGDPSTHRSGSGVCPLLDLDHDLHDLEVLVNETLNGLENAGAEPAGEGGAASQATSITEPLGDAEGVSAGRTFPGPLVDVARKPISHHRGPPRRKKKLTGARTSLEESKYLEKLLSDVDSQRDAASTSTHSDIIWKSMRRVFCCGTPCLIKLMAIVAGAALCLMMCCAAIWYCWTRKWYSCVSPEDQPKNRGNDNLTVYPISSLPPLFELPWLHEHHEASQNPPLLNETLCP
ncbi:uncharacterized protein LOC135307259 [Passer domesticus]|uniref:uncharacterized protein LOC135307259 n=1 Tax=Passer domesticus TaxID=48849 RepID=UPI0030FEC99B